MSMFDVSVGGRVSVDPSRPNGIISISPLGPGYGIVGSEQIVGQPLNIPAIRSEEHTSELQSLMRISYAVFCLKKKNTNKNNKEHDDKKDNNNSTQLDTQTMTYDTNTIHQNNTEQQQ